MHARLQRHYSLKVLDLITRGTNPKASGADYGSFCTIPQKGIFHVETPESHYEALVSTWHR